MQLMFQERGCYWKLTVDLGAIRLWSCVPDWENLGFTSILESLPTPVPPKKLTRDKSVFKSGTQKNLASLYADQLDAEKNLFLHSSLGSLVLEERFRDWNWLLSEFLLYGISQGRIQYSLLGYDAPCHPTLELLTTEPNDHHVTVVWIQQQQENDMTWPGIHIIGHKLVYPLILNALIQPYHFMHDIEKTSCLHLFCSNISLIVMMSESSCPNASQNCLFGVHCKMNWFFIISKLSCYPLKRSWRLDPCSWYTLSIPK